MVSGINLGQCEAGVKQKKILDQDHDDVVSYCGSFSGNTFSIGRRKRGAINNCSLRSHNSECLPQNLDQSTGGGLEVVKQPQQNHTQMITQKQTRINTFFHGYRFLVLVMAGCSVGSMMLLRYNICVAIIRMVNQTALYLEEHPDRTIDDFKKEGHSLGGEFLWNNEIQQMLMSWYMIAYSLPQFPMTKIAVGYGARFSIFCSLIVMCITTLMVPFAAYIGWKWVLALRMLTGIGASIILPLSLSLIENWLPISQYSLGLTIIYLFTALSIAFNPLLVGFLAALDWKYAFYVPGCISTVFSLIWLLLVTDRPDENKLISQKELDLICSCKNGPTKVVEDKEVGNKKTDQDLAKPQAQAVWSDIFKVPSMYAYMIVWCCYCSSFSPFSYILPTYLRQFLKIDVKTNGIYCFIIQLGGIIAVTLPLMLLKLFQSKKVNLSLTNARKITHLIICLVTSFTWIYVGQYHKHQLVLLFINRCFHAGVDIVTAGAIMSNYAPLGLSSIAFSIMNTVGNGSIILVSTFMGYVLDYYAQSAAAWGWIIKGLGISQLLMTLIFCTVIDSNPVQIKKDQKI